MHQAKIFSDSSSTHSEQIININLTLTTKKPLSEVVTADHLFILKAAKRNVEGTFMEHCTSQK